MACETLQRAQPTWSDDVRRNQKVNMIGHDHECVQSVALNQRSPSRPATTTSAATSGRRRNVGPFSARSKMRSIATVSKQPWQCTINHMGRSAGTHCPRPESEDCMTMLSRLEQWKEHGVISPEQ